MKKLLLLSSTFLLLLTLNAEENEQECEYRQGCQCENHTNCHRKHRRPRSRHDYDTPDNAERAAAWPGKIEDSFYEEMMR